jgi:prolyl oligopeptidase
MRKFIGGAMALIIFSGCGRQDATEPVAEYDFSKDNYTWLEDVEGDKALAWVEEQNAVSLGHLEALPLFAQLKERNLEIYNSDERIAAPTMRGDYVYNFWRDEDNIRGRWRRMLLDDYIEGSEEWGLVLDIDLLAEGEDEDWVWKGAQCLRPEYRRCLLNLSRGGADAVVVREFDVDTKTFVMDGFSIAEAKQQVSWIDKNAVWIGSDFGESRRMSRPAFTEPGIGMTATTSPTVRRAFSRG